MSKGRDVIREILSRRDPQGYYVIPLRNVVASKRLVEKFGVDFEEVGDMLLARVRSRSVAQRLALEAARRGLLAL